MRCFSGLIKHRFLVKIWVLAMQLFKCFLKKDCVNVCIKFMSPKSLNSNNAVFVDCRYLDNFFHPVKLSAVVMRSRLLISESAYFYDVRIFQKSKLIDVNNSLMVDSQLPQQFSSNIRHVLSKLRTQFVHRHSFTFL